MPGLPEIEAGADLAEMIHAQCVAAETDLVDGDVVIVTSKIVSKAEGAFIELDDIVPSPFAASWSEAWEKDPRVVEVVLRESCLLYTSPSPRDLSTSRMPSSA